MKLKFFISAVTAIVAVTASAKISSYPWPANSFTEPSVERTPTALVLRMTVNPAAFTLKSDRQVWLRPAVVSDGDTLWFNPIIVAGRNRYNMNIRGRVLPQDWIQLRAGSAEKYSYQAIVPYQEWMDVCRLVLTGTVTGCCGDELGRMKPDQPLASCDFRLKELKPQYIYVSPTKEFVKTRSAKGEAYIDFPVGQSRILPEYRDNSIELKKIRTTINKVRDDSDVKITSISFKGFASPEGAYATNERLAKERTEALINYVKGIYSFPANIMHSSWVAEDWAGLEKHLRSLDIDRKEAILAVVTDKSLTPDQKEARLKKDFPAQYEFLLTQVYPALRHSDYVVTYNVREDTDVKEIAVIMGTSPQKLSLAELFLYAQSLDKSSPEFKEVMEVAVRMYPDDPIANLNAAMTAVSRGEYGQAVAYLKKSEDSAQKDYIAGLIEAMQGRHAESVPLFTRASKAGIAEAEDMLSQMRKWGWIK